MKIFMIELEDNMSYDMEESRGTEIIRRLNYKNKEEFISKLGLIKDISLAQKALIISPNAWFVIDDSLKMLPEVIVYYQPVGYIIYNDGGHYSNSEFAIPKGFKMLPNCQILPSIKWPKNFDKQIYLNIQKFIQDKTYGLVNEWFQIADNTTFYTPYFGHVSLDEITHDYHIIKCCRFSRRYIQEAVNTFYEPKGKSKIKK